MKSKTNEVPPPEKEKRRREKKKKGVKREGKGNADDLCCGVWSKADSKVSERNDKGVHRK